MRPPSNSSDPGLPAMAGSRDLDIPALVPVDTPEGSFGRGLPRILLQSYHSMAVIVARRTTVHNIGHLR